jgi:hypothetical protein
MPFSTLAAPIIGTRNLAIVLLLAGFATAAHATIVGLNQIVTPDIQPAGVLAISAQAQHSAIGNSQQFQFELGLTSRLEAGLFQGLKPTETFAAAELNLIQSGPHLLTAGIVNWSTRGGGAQPVLEYGYYKDADHFVVGGIQANDHTWLLLGYKRTLSDQVSFSADFQSGPAGYSTVGLTYNFTPTFSVNPALYYSNSQPHHLFGYIVFTWNLTVWGKN